jgi:predicted extracellular nuclease
MKRRTHRLLVYALILALIISFLPSQVRQVYAVSPDIAAPLVSTTDPAQGAKNVLLDSNITVTFNEPVILSGSWFLLSCLTSGIHTAVVSGGPTIFTLNPDTDFAFGEICTFIVFASSVTDQNVPPGAMAGNSIISFNTVSSPVAIHDIQGAAHLSPKNGQAVNTQGIVTALRTTGTTRGFYLQDPNPDANPATSEGVFVFSGATSDPASLVAVGDLVQIAATVSEYRADAVELTVTELVAPYTITTVSSGNALPAPIVLGTGGLVPPSAIIEDDATGSVETTGIFDPASDGIDFYESLEGMLVQVNDAVAVGPRSDFTSNREIAVVGDNGANASVRTNRGGLVAQANDFNPERIILNDWISSGPILPAANVGDTFPGAITGVIDYSFNNFKLQVISMPALVSGGLTQETASAAGLNQISVATFNVSNLAPTDPASEFSTLAGLIVNNLQSPDIISIEEIQDNSGATDDGVVDASTTWNMLIAAIQSAGGPAYEFRQIDPVNDQDGGATGGNIRVGFLFRTDRGLSFIDRVGATSTTADAVTGSGAATQLLYSPGLIDPTNAAFNTSRKPLAGEFMFNGHHLFVIANHWNSKSGDPPLFGVNQPPVFSSEVQRNQQATVVHDFVNSILAADPNANVIVLGDLNDYQFSSALTTLKGSPAILTDMIETLSLAEQYTYVYEGNSETLDHILVSDALTARPYVYDVVYVNSEFAVQASDHEPQAMLITLNDPPTADAGGPYTVDEGQSVAVSATGSDLEGGPLTYAWDLDNNGTFETSGQSVLFTGADGPADQTIAVKVTDNGGLFTVATTTVHINSVSVPLIVDIPVVSPEPSKAGAAVAASATFSYPGIATDLFTCTVDFGDGTGVQPGIVIDNLCSAPNHVYLTFGKYTVNFTVTDADGSTGSNSAIHKVIFNFDGFFPPLDNLLSWLWARAGQSLPIKFSLGGDRGLDIFIVNYPQSIEVDCNTFQTIDLTGTPTVNPGSSDLRYSSGGQYNYIWKTEKAWVGTCRQLVIKLIDGSEYAIVIKFK